MKCPRCKQDNDRVVDSRAAADGGAIRRRRECLQCFLRYTTYERVEDTPLRVIKKSGERVRFERERVLAGMMRACEKLPVATEDLEQAAARVEARCQEEHDREVPSSVIGALVMEELKKLNHVAYVRFASVYRQFKDTNEFLSELSQLLSPERAERGASRRLERERLGGARPQAASDEAEETPPSTNLLKDRG